MTKPRQPSCDDARVAAAKLPAAGYPSDAAAASDGNEVSAALVRLAHELGWGDEQSGAFASLIPRGARVLIKPNFVTHENSIAGGIEPLVTHPSLVRAVVEAVLKTEAAEVLVGDAPIQGCDFTRLLRATNLDDWSEELMRRDSRFRGIRDFRRTIAVVENGVRVAAENLQNEADFVLFDLGHESLLEPVTDESGAFRVTCYDPRLMRRTHAPGRHQYSIARDVLQADVVINLPKLKTHRKAGITCALKNLIGINGNKEFLPHHRIGGAGSGGDCYPGVSPLKRSLEFVLDQQNSTHSMALARVWRQVGTQLQRAASLAGDTVGVEGSWSGNDTIWRTALDLNRVILYGRLAATFADTPSRLVVHIADAIVAGQGDGPLAPEALPMGLLLGSWNAAAMDWVGAYLLGYDPLRIPIARQAFGPFRWPLATFAHHSVRVAGDLGEGLADQLFGTRQPLYHVKHPGGWADAAATPSPSRIPSQSPAAKR